MTTASAPPAAPPAPAVEADEPRSSRALIHGVTLGAAATLWVAGLIGARADAVAGLGLLDALPVTFFGALALLIVGFALAVSFAESSTRLLGAYVIGAVVVLHATAAILYDSPRYAWTYKHVGVTDLIGASGRADPSLDVYNGWPGLFTLGAWLSRATGLEPLEFAAWAQPVFALAWIAVLVFVLRGVTRRPAVIWTTAFLFVLSDWIGQNYYSPQALAFLLSLVVIGLCLRCAPPAAPPAPPPPGRLRRWGPAGLVRRLRAAEARRPGPGEAPLPPRAAVAVGAVCFAALVMTHQLSPILLIAQVVALAVVTGRIPRRVLAGMIAIEAAWLALMLPSLLGKFNVLDFDPGATPTVNLPSREPDAGVAITALTRQGLMLTVLLLAAIGLVVAIRDRRLSLAVPALVVAPAVVVVLQPYGGEGIFRVYLFALPWLCVLAATAILSPRRRRGPVARFSRVVVAGGLLLALLLPAYFGAEVENRVAEDDVAVVSWFEENAEPGARLTTVLPAVPQATTRFYARFGGADRALPALTDYEPFRDYELGPESLDDIRRVLAEQGGTAEYLIVSPLQERVSDHVGVFPPGSVARLTWALLDAPDFDLAFRYRSGYVFRWSADAAPGEPSGPPRGTRP